MLCCGFPDSREEVGVQNECTVSISKEGSPCSLVIISLRWWGVEVFCFYVY